MYVKPKKHLGQHFLKNDNIAMDIAQAITNTSLPILEIGPGTGVLTKHILKRNQEFFLSEIDHESIAFIKHYYPELQEKIKGDFLHENLNNISDKELIIAGNFPYNISTQILFKVYENKEKIVQVVGMFQKEVAERVCSNPHSKVYGILSPLLQSAYNVEYLFTVNENEFIPPPKVKSAVIRLTRKSKYNINCNEKLFRTIIKTGFNHRRKTLRNSLKQLISAELAINPVFNARPEELSWEDFVELTNLIENIK